MSRDDIIRFRKDDPKPAFRNWYELFKDELDGRHCLVLPELETEICFGEVEVRKLNEPRDWYSRAKLHDAKSTKGKNVLGDLSVDFADLDANVEMHNGRANQK